MKTEIAIIGAGASGLMAAYAAARTLAEDGNPSQVTVLERMPRPARKVMITGKGRCNFTNLKDWNDFSAHVRSKSNFVKSAFYNMNSSAVIDFFEGMGMPTVVERGDRAFPQSHHASDVVDALVNAAQRYGVKIITECSVEGIEALENGGFAVSCEDGRIWTCRKLIIATGGLSYPTTGSTGDGLRWAESTGHKISQCFPSLTALVPKGYKVDEIISRGKCHIDRSTPLSEYGKLLCGIQLKNVGLSSLIEGTVAQEEFGDVDFTDGGIEGPLGFQLSRKCVKAMVNGSRVTLRLDLKHGIDIEDVTERVKALWNEVGKDPRSRGKSDKEKCRILLGKLMPWDLIPGFLEGNPGIITIEHRGRTNTKIWVSLNEIARCLKCWEFELAGFVGYERCVVTAGGVSNDDMIAKTMESRVVPGLYFCGEVTDVDADTGGYNLQLAFSTGSLAGRSAAKSL